MSKASESSRPRWRITRGITWSLDRPRLIGILNVTPDSFSDGGRFADVDAAVAHARKMINEGADIIDIGGESTRPGAARVAADEQTGRVLPVIRRLRDAGEDVIISIDTTLAPVAEAALDAGAKIINDVAAGREDDRMFAVAADRGCGLILMHRLRPPDADRYSDQYATPPVYDDVVQTVREFLIERINAAVKHGVARESIVIDPGLGFGKTVEQNFDLIARTNVLTDIGFPVLSAASRKSFIGKASGVDDPSQRLAGSLAVSVAHYLAGIRLFRVHDVAAHRQALAVAEAVTNATLPASK